MSQFDIFSQAKLYKNHGQIHDGYVCDILITPDGYFLFSVGKDLCLRQWLVEDEVLWKSFEAICDTWITCVVATWDSKFLFIGDDSGCLKQWDVYGEREVRGMVGGKVHRGGVRGLCVSWDSKWLFSSDGGSVVKQWD